ncbi:SufD family Fe-S cluster assembly protein [bacterium]|nr:SufD family Fe-S cluster assembly protein [bacterium]
MIYLDQLVRNEGNGLSLRNNILTIHQTMTDYLAIDRSLSIIVEAGVHALLCDVSCEEKIHIEVKSDAILEYQILDSKNTYRSIHSMGEVKITEICLEESHEDLEIQLVAPSSKAFVESLVLASQFKQIFNQRILHQQKDTSSNISNFGVAIHGGEILFDTTGKIEKGMSKSKCVQLSKGIVMDDSSSVTSKPILCIDEYDVVANHGASIGKMSDESLFYLMSRGLSKQEAFLLILEGIVGPFIAKIADPTLKDKINNQIEQLMKR